MREKERKRGKGGGKMRMKRKKREGKVEREAGETRREGGSSYQT